MSFRLRPSREMAQESVTDTGRAWYVICDKPRGQLPSGEGQGGEYAATEETVSVLN